MRAAARFNGAAGGCRRNGEASATLVAVDELSEAEIDEAEGLNASHSHDGISAEDGTLLDHLHSVHRLAVEAALSSATQTGVHDRLHHESKAVDDPP